MVVERVPDPPTHMYSLLYLMTNDPQQPHSACIDKHTVCNMIGPLSVNNSGKEIKRECSTLPQVKCIALKSASRNRPDPSLRRGLSWLLQAILDQYSELSSRVKTDVTAQREGEAIERRERMERVRKIKEDRERYIIVVNFNFESF